MKNFLTIFGLVSIASIMLASAALADKVVKSCNVTLKVPGEARTVPTSFQIIEKNGQLIGQSSQIVDGKSVVLPEDTVTVEAFSVRPALNAQMEDPEVAPFFNAGFDLELVRHAKLYTIGRATHMGATVILEASDENGKSLGSAMTGFFTFPCEN